MMLLTGFINALIYLIFVPFLFVVVLTLVLATSGKSLGIRKLYVQSLLQVFEVSLSLLCKIHLHMHCSNSMQGAVQMLKMRSRTFLLDLRILPIVKTVRK